MSRPVGSARLFLRLSPELHAAVLARGGSEWARSLLSLATGQGKAKRALLVNVTNGPTETQQGPAGYGWAERCDDEEDVWETTIAMPDGTIAHVTIQMVVP